MTLSLGFPWALLLLPLPFLVWRFAPPYREKTSAMRIPFFRAMTQAAGVEPQQGALVLQRSVLQMAVAALVWVLIVLALARPERLGDPITIETSARDIVLALDISGSMDDRDFVGPDGQPQQRLAAVTNVLKTFISERESDRMALIVFGTRAFVQATFTEDLDSLSGFLDQTAVGMAGPNTAIGDAIGLGIRAFEASEVEERLMILLSDGADTSSRVSPVNAAEFAADKGVVIHTIGVGDPKGSGEDRVDLDSLQDIADRTGGQFFFAQDEDALTAIYQEIDALTPRAVDTVSYRPKISLVYLPLSAALIVLLTFTATMRLASLRLRAAQ